MGWRSRGSCGRLPQEHAKEATHRLAQLMAVDRNQRRLVAQLPRWREAATRLLGPGNDQVLAVVLPGPELLGTHDSWFTTVTSFWQAQRLLLCAADGLQSPVSPKLYQCWLRTTGHHAPPDSLTYIVLG